MYEGRLEGLRLFKKVREEENAFTIERQAEIWKEINKQIYRQKVIGVSKVLGATAVNLSTRFILAKFGSECAAKSVVFSNNGQSDFGMLFGTMSVIDFATAFMMPNLLRSPVGPVIYRRRK